MKKALITGITGQDGSYLAEFLLEKGYEVHGMKRRASSFNTSRIDHLYQDIHKDSNFKLHYGDLSDFSSLIKLVHDIEPDEILPVILVIMERNRDRLNELDTLQHVSLPLDLHPRKTRLEGLKQGIREKLPRGLHVRCRPRLLNGIKGLLDL